jgi:ATP-dependent Clp protease ATP-binding subunit ClpA
MMTTFHSFLRTLLEQAAREAQGDGSTIEAQHLLLAMASQPEAETSELLNSLGLDHRAIRAALDVELKHTLNAAGVSVAASSVQHESTTNRTPQLGPSVQHALERGLGKLRAAPRPAHVLLGILQADVGTVPRALALAGLDRAALIVRVRQSLEVPA